MNNSLPYRPNVCMLVVNRQQRLFLGQRYQQPTIWQFPQGGAEPHLSLEENVIKELHEELGAPAEKFRIIKQLRTTHQYDFSDPPAYARGVWRGQKQTFWLVSYLGEDADFNFTLHDPEFMGFKWCTSAEVLALAEPKRLDGYQIVLKEYDDIFKNLGHLA